MAPTSCLLIALVRRSGLVGKNQGKWMPSLHLTVGRVNALPRAQPGKQLIYRDTELEGFGLRVGASRKAYFVERRVNGRSVRHTIGNAGEMTAEQARLQARKRLGEMADGQDLNLRRQNNRQAAIAARAASKAAGDQTVAALTHWYVEHQRARGKQSAEDARYLFERYVGATEFAALPARVLTRRQVTEILRRVVEAGHLRTAAKLRSYMRAAYALALGAETNSQAPSALLSFAVESNPVADTKAIQGASKARKVTLTDAELGEFMRMLAERRARAYDPALAAIELSVYLGGQRLQQVLRLAIGDVNDSEGTVTIQDPKGRRDEPRQHVLPLTASAAALLKKILQYRQADWLFGDRKTRTSPDTLAGKGVAILRAAQAVVASTGRGATDRPKLEPRDLRRTAETMLSRLGVSRDVRAQLLSHGLGGVQARHYDQHDYMHEKRAALEAWERHLLALMAGKATTRNVRRLRKA